MPRSAAANEQIRGTQRAAILEAARVVFAQRGLAATMDEVAQAAGVSHGLAYRYFPGKARLFRALAEDALTRPPEGPGLLAGPGTPGERLGHLLSAVLRNRREHPETFQLLHHVLNDRGAPRDLLELAQERGRQFRHALRQLIVEGQASGEVADDDPGQLVTAITACLDGLGRAAADPSGHSRASFPDAGIVLRMLTPPPEGPAPGGIPT